LMHPLSKRPRSAQRQSTCVDIRASLSGHGYFGKGFYLETALSSQGAKSTLLHREHRKRPSPLCPNGRSQSRDKHCLLPSPAGRGAGGEGCAFFGPDAEATQVLCHESSAWVNVRYSTLTPALSQREREKYARRFSGEFAARPHFTISHLGPHARAARIHVGQGRQPSHPRGQPVDHLGPGSSRGTGLAYRTGTPFEADQADGCRPSLTSSSATEPCARSGWASHSRRGPSGALAGVQRCLGRVSGHPFRGARHPGRGGRCPRDHPRGAQAARR